MSYRISPITHGNFTTLLTQNYTGSTTSATSTGQLVYFDNNFDLLGISLSGQTGILVSSRGNYMFNVSAIFSQTSTTGVGYQLWFSKNGTLIPDSNTRMTIQNATVEQIMSVPFIIGLVKGDVIEIRWYCSSANGQLVATAAVGAVRPRTPGIIVGVVKVSE